ncbi:MAG TPA: YggT family protein [Actinobacteria bacterium]|nr:YggT family protein [Actinomycetota bacterium]
MSLLCSLLSIYVVLILARIVLEWIRVPSDHPVAQIKRLVALAVDPLLIPIRRMLPDMPMGGMRLDLSPLLLLLGVRVVASLVGC